ncbi:MAG: hypothetical protein WC941_01095, partial [Candidatus Bathyarchaeia archaeon]
DPPLTLQLKLGEGISLLRDIGVPAERVILVFNKVDKASADTVKNIEGELSLDHYDLPWTTVSADKRTNLNGLLDLIAWKIKELKNKPPAPEPIILIQEPPVEDPEEVVGDPDAEDEEEDES